MATKYAKFHGLMPDETYVVQVRARGIPNETSDSDWSTALTFTTSGDTVAPNAPSSPSITFANDSIWVEWTAPTANEDSSTIEDFRDYRVDVYDNAAPSTKITRYTDEIGIEFSHSWIRSEFSGISILGVDIYSRDANGNTSTTAANVTGTVPAAAFGADDLSDVDTTTTPPASHDVLYWNGAGWVPGTSNRYLNATAADIAAGLITFNAGVKIGASQIIDHNATSSYDKIRLWNNSQYSIGMTSGNTFGGLTGDFCTTFTMGSGLNRGWLWRYDTHGTSEGAMSLDVEGHLHVDQKITISGTDTAAEVATKAYVTGLGLDDHSDVDTVTSPPSDGEALVWSASGSKWEPGSVASSAQNNIEVGQIDSTTGALEFRWGIDSSGRPYFDSTASVVESEAARVYLNSNDGRIYAEALGL